MVWCHSEAMAEHSRMRTPSLPCTSPTPQELDELTERGKAWCQSLESSGSRGVAGSQTSHCQGHRERRPGDSKGPQSVSKSLETGHSRQPHTRTQHHPESGSYKWKCILRGAEHEWGFFRNDPSSDKNTDGI